jgi:excisionase family DNA binding protein
MTVEAPTPELLTIRDVAALLNVSYDTVWRRVNRGELPSLDTGGGLRRGRCIRIASGDLVTYLQRVNGEG